VNFKYRNNPLAAFLFVGFCLLLVAGRVAWVSHYRPKLQPELEQSTPGRLPEYTILDQKGRTIAYSVPRFDLEMSPRSMWQVHTPARIAKALGAALGGQYTQQELLGMFFPSAVDGVISAQRFKLNARQANAVGSWLAGQAGGEDEPEVPIQGMWLEEQLPGRQWIVAWRPAVLLSEVEREAHGYGSAWTWGRALAHDLVLATHGKGFEFPREDAPAQDLRDGIWEKLIPRASACIVKAIPSERVMAVREVFKDQHISSWHMRLGFGRDRVYPAGEQELFGDWGYVSEEDTEPRPRAGLELMCERMIHAQPFEERLAAQPSEYRYRQDRTILGQRTNTYVDYQEASEAPFLESSLDLHLQDYLTEQLEDLMREHRPALAMGIVVDVASGDVLAVNSLEAYEVAAFAPIWYTYTIGSTFKIMTMACALEEGLVQANTRLEVGSGAFRVPYLRGPKKGRMSSRVIREAEGAKQGTIEARDAFAFSVNAGLAQVGLRMEDHVFRGYLTELGYGQVAGSGLGNERAGLLPGLPWSYAFTHASISFGHEITTTLWQHANAIDTVLRGGIPVPLRLVRAVGQNATKTELVPVEGERIFSRETCETIRSMMRHGADIGTGRHARADLEKLALAALPATEREGKEGSQLVEVGTKTGTAQKVSTEVCVHVEKIERMRLAAAGQKMTSANYRSLKMRKKDHRNCYTSSIVIFAKDRRSGRELMTYVVAEEPRGKLRFGSQVAGPAAVRVIAEALGYTVDGEAARPSVSEGVYQSYLADRNLSEEPWDRAEVSTW